MSILNVNPTRMSLLSLRVKLKTAHRGHKLLKDKRDGLMKHFMEIIREARSLRLEIEKEMGEGLARFLYASFSLSSEELMTAFSFPESNLNLEVKTKKVMSVSIPQFKAKIEGTLKNYGYLRTTGDLDLGIENLEKLLQKLFRLAEVEKTAENLAEEIEKVRRRVNALEYTMIPNYEETIKFIQMKLGEQERSTIISTMIVKSMIEDK
jgi:V/A-type H+-transporting ATPase subunit D